MSRFRFRLPASAAQAALIFALNVGVAWPYGARGIPTRGWGNDIGYMAVARLFREQPWTWNALQYCGAPFRYLYPPLFHALVAGFPAGIARAFHICGVGAYALAAAGLYFLTLELARSRAAAIFAAGWYSVLASPVGFVLPSWRIGWGRLGWAPLNLAALTLYDEAPHLLGFALALFSLALAWRRQTRAAIVCAAAVLLTNVPAAVGLFMMLAALAVARRNVRDALGTGGMALGLAAFWITPGYGATIALTGRALLSAPQPAWTWGAAGIALLGALFFAGSLSKRLSPGSRFTLAWVAIAGTVVVLNSACGIALAPLANRYAMEWNAALIIGIALALASLPRKARFLLVLAAIGLGVWFARSFLANPWRGQAQTPGAEPLVSLQAAEWLGRNAEGARTLASGDVENGLDAWGPVRQEGGSFTGMSNLVSVAAANRIQGSCAAPDAERELTGLWLRALDVRYVVVNQSESAESFHWMAHPDQFAGYQRVWTNGRGDEIVEVPENGGDATVVDLGALEQLPKLQSIADPTFARAYAEWANGVRPARLRWDRNDHGTVEAETGPGEGVLVKVSFDPGWRSSLGRVEADPIGFTLIRTGAGKRVGDLRFGFSWDTWLGWGMMLASAALLLRGRHPTWAAVTMACVWGIAFLSFERAGAPAARIAAREFRENRLPLINFGGIVAGPSAPGGERTFSLYGVNFGGNRVRVLVGGREARVLFHGANLVNASVAGAHAGDEVSVEIDGCRGNAFRLAALR